MATNFAERLREERFRTGLNQLDFGALAGVTKSAQLNYEKGDRSPDAVYLMALLPHGVDVHYLLTGVRAEQAGAGLTPGQALWLKLESQLHDEDRAVALHVQEALIASRQKGSKARG